MSTAEEMARTELLKRAAAARMARIALARVDSSEFNSLVLKDERTGSSVEQAPIHHRWHELLAQNDRLVVWSHIESGKALALDTPIPTPSGWQTMGDLQVGDTVFAGDGTPTLVTGATEVQHGRTCYRVTFSDGSELIADADHRWLTWTDDGYAKGRGPSVVTTAEMLERGITVGTKSRKYQMYKFRVPVCASVQYPHRDLPVHPYVLGAWLGDGTTTVGSITYHPIDRFVFDRCLELTGLHGGYIGRKPETDAVTQSLVSSSKPGDRHGLTSQLRALDVLGHKHIPEVYMVASEEQRLELLAGLLDTDGHASLKNRVEFSSVSKALGLQVQELARSLGFKAVLTERSNHVRVTFTAWRQVFKLPRKAAGITSTEMSKSLAVKTIHAIEPVPSVPVRCIQVAHPDHTYLAGRSYTVTHNSSQLTIGHTLWTLGRDPNKRVVIVSNTAGQSSKMVRTIARYIESSAELKAVFPDLEKDEPWTSSQLFVKRKTQAKDPSVQATGVHGAVVGARVDLLILDDILDFENTRSEQARNDLQEWFDATLGGRLTADARVIAVGTAWHPDDIMHRLAKKNGWKSVRFPVISDAGEVTWPERWPLHRIERRRDELGPVEYARQLQCVARDDSTSRFQKSWIDVALQRGNGKQMAYALSSIPDGCKVFTGVDLAVQQTKKSDLTVLFTILFHPNGDREVLNIESGRMAGPQIVQRIADVHRRFNSIIIVESNAAQDFIRQFLTAQSGVPVRPFNTGRNKSNPEFGVESIAAEMAGGKWIIPNENGTMEPEVQAFVNGMLYYDPTEHTSDYLMASWFAREGFRLGTPKVAQVGRLNLTRR